MWPSKVKAVHHSSGNTEKGKSQHYKLRLSALQGALTELGMVMVVFLSGVSVCVGFWLCGFCVCALLLFLFFVCVEVEGGY